MKKLLSLRGNRKAQTGFMSIAFLSLFMLLAAFIVGCDKETPLGVDKPSNPEQQNEQTEKISSVTIEIETAKFSFNGKLLAKDEFQRALERNASSIMVAGTGLPEANVVYAFDSDANFNAWAKTTQFAEQFAKMGQPVSDQGGARILGAGGWARLYDGNLGGASRFYASPRYISFLESFNDRTSSVEVYSGSYQTTCLLYEHINGGGRRLYLTSGSPRLLVRFTQSVLSFWAFNNVASAVYVY